jgi:hypothetical protein
VGIASIASIAGIGVISALHGDYIRAEALFGLALDQSQGHPRSEVYIRLQMAGLLYKNLASPSVRAIATANVEDVFRCLEQMRHDVLYTELYTHAVAEEERIRRGALAEGIGQTAVYPQEAPTEIIPVPDPKEWATLDGTRVVLTPGTHNGNGRNGASPHFAQPPTIFEHGRGA